MTILSLPRVTPEIVAGGIPASLASEIDIHAVSRPATFFTGDFYHYGFCEEGVLFALGDVAGKGLDAAIFMVMIQEILERKIAEGGASCCLPELVKAIHDEIGEELPANRFASLVLGHMAPDRSLQLVNAGHFPPIVRRASGAIEPILPGGPVVGIHPAPRWESHYLRLGRGDTLVLYTDGILESLSPAGEEFGLTGITNSVSRMPDDAGASELVARVFSDVAQFRNGADPHDDSTVMVIRV